MAAVTVTRRRTVVFGNRRVIDATLTIADTNTWATGFHLIETIQTCVTASNQEVAATASAGTITFAVANGPATSTRVTVIGY